MKRIFKIALITFLSGAIFFVAAYVYLDYNFNKSASDVDEKDYNVFYHKSPENCGVMFIFPQGSATLIYLKFSDECIELYDIEKYDTARTEYYGYTADYEVVANADFIKGIIDRVGGIEIERSGETLRYTGIQVLELLEKDGQSNLRKHIVAQILKQISENNFSRDDFVFMLENSKTNLSMIECMDWVGYIKVMSGNVSFLN